MAEFRKVWMRFQRGWKHLFLIWPRLVFLITFFFASVVLTFSVIAWIQLVPGRQSEAITSEPVKGIPALTPKTTASPDFTPAPINGASVPPQDEPYQSGKNDPLPATAYDASIKLIIPVEGIKTDQLRDTFSEARSEGRVHNAIDIIAPQGAKVLAAMDGKIVRLFNSERGGITIYQLSEDQKLVLYYAHLERYADGLNEGRLVKQGEVIAYVGDTGNASAGNYHLHFALWVVTDPKRYWEGSNLNPYPLLRGVH